MSWQTPSWRPSERMRPRAGPSRVVSQATDEDQPSPAERSLASPERVQVAGFVVFVRINFGPRLARSRLVFANSAPRKKHNYPTPWPASAGTAHGASRPTCPLQLRVQGATATPALRPAGCPTSGGRDSGGQQQTDPPSAKTVIGAVSPAHTHQIRSGKAGNSVISKETCHTSAHKIASAQIGLKKGADHTNQGTCMSREIRLSQETLTQP